MPVTTPSRVFAKLQLLDFEAASSEAVIHTGWQEKLLRGHGGKFDINKPLVQKKRIIFKFDETPSFNTIVDPLFNLEFQQFFLMTRNWRDEKLYVLFIQLIKKSIATRK